MTDDARLDDYVDSLLAEPCAAPAPVVEKKIELCAEKPAPAVATPAPLLPSEIPAYLRAVLDATQPAPPPSVPRPKRWLHFDVGGQRFGVELLKVQEVQRVPTIVPVRGAPSDLLGIINLRGVIVHVIDLGLHLGFAATDARSDAARVVVLEANGNAVGLLVSRVAEVASLRDSDIERAETALCAFPCAALLGIARHGSTLVTLLDGSDFLK
jgi:purine-binding chemotaxis protein CheW